jgi:transposase InsO family protein
VAFVNRWSARTELPVRRLLKWLELSGAKFYDWCRRRGLENQHNGAQPRDFWVLDWERERVIEYYKAHRLDGYRRLTFMMLDENIVAVSPSSTWRILRRAELLNRWNLKESKKGTGFIQPLVAHEHWHIDISYLNISGTFYYLIAVIDGASRYIVAWDIRTQMTEWDVEIVLQRAKETFPKARPRIISDNGPQFIATEFKEFIRISGMTHVRTSPYYPQSNGKSERVNKTIKVECIRPQVPLSLDDAKRLVARYVEHYNNVRLHSSIGYVAPAARLAGRHIHIFSERRTKLEQARTVRQNSRSNLSTSTMN